LLSPHTIAAAFPHLHPDNFTHQIAVPSGKAHFDIVVGVAYSAASFLLLHQYLNFPTHKAPVEILR
jgi:hypothetical protein